MARMRSLSLYAIHMKTGKFEVEEIVDIRIKEENATPGPHVSLSYTNQPRINVWGVTSRSSGHKQRTEEELKNYK